MIAQPQYARAALCNTLILWLLAVVLDGKQNGVRAPHPSEEAFASEVSTDRLRHDVRDLVALGPRMGGTPSGDRAAAHVDRLFRGMGLDSGIERDPELLAHWEDEWAVEIAPAGGRLESAWPYRLLAVCRWLG